jgi:hypothetical protein
MPQREQAIAERSAACMERQGREEDGKLTRESLAALIVDALLDAGIVARPDLDKAIAIVTEEIDARKAARDY